MSVASWKAWRKDVADALKKGYRIIDRVELPTPSASSAPHLRAEIAMANDLLPDSDPHKFTPDNVAALREHCAGGRSTAAPVSRLIEALESYLPPAKTGRGSQ